MDIRRELAWELEIEGVKTRTTLEAVPEEADFGWRPHPRSFSLARLAGHVAEIPGELGVQVLSTDKVEMGSGDKDKGFVPAGRSESLQCFDQGLARLQQALGEVTPEGWDQRWRFIVDGTTHIDLTRYRAFRVAVLNHLVHHRAQLGVYIRLLGGRVPGVCGPSADSA